MESKYVKVDTLDNIAIDAGVCASTIVYRQAKFGREALATRKKGRISPTMLFFDGQLYTKAEVARKIGVSPQVMQWRMKKYGDSDPRTFAPGDRRHKEIKNAR